MSTPVPHLRTCSCTNSTACATSRRPSTISRSACNKKPGGGGGMGLERSLQNSTTHRPTGLPLQVRCTVTVLAHLPPPPAPAPLPCLVCRAHAAQHIHHLSSEASLLAHLGGRHRNHRSLHWCLSCFALLPAAHNLAGTTGRSSQHRLAAPTACGAQSAYTVGHTALLLLTWYARSNG